MSSTEWLDGALCAQVGGDLWFPQKEGWTPADAKKVCMRCPVRVACLNDAITRHETQGIRGGMTPYQRSRYTRDRSAA